jgi:hypothetical protein
MPEKKARYRFPLVGGEEFECMAEGERALRTKEVQIDRIGLQFIRALFAVLASAPRRLRAHNVDTAPSGLHSQECQKGAPQRIEVLGMEPQSDEYLGYHVLTPGVVGKDHPGRGSHRSRVAAVQLGIAIAALIDE